MSEYMQPWNCRVKVLSSSLNYFRLYLKISPDHGTLWERNRSILVLLSSMVPYCQINLLCHYFYFLIKLLFQFFSTNVNHCCKLLHCYSPVVHVAFIHNSKPSFSHFVTTDRNGPFIEVICDIVYH